MLSFSQVSIYEADCYPMMLNKGIAGRAMPLHWLGKRPQGAKAPTQTTAVFFS